MKYQVTYTRTLTLTEIIDAQSLEEAEHQAQEREDDLLNKEFDDADTEHDLEELTLRRMAQVKVIAEGNLHGATGKVTDIYGPFEGGRQKVYIDFGTVKEPFWDDELEVLSW